MGCILVLFIGLLPLDAELHSPADWDKNPSKLMQRTNSTPPH